MVEINKTSSRSEVEALSKVLNGTKEMDMSFVPLNYDYGQNYIGPKLPNGIQTPDQYREKLRKKEKTDNF